MYIFFYFPSSPFVFDLAVCIFMVLMKGSFSRDNPLVIEEVNGGVEVKEAKVSAVVL